MDDYYDWDPETDGPPPADSNIAYLFDEVGPPHQEYEMVEPQVIKSPPMGDITMTWRMSSPDIFFAIVALAVVGIAVWLIGRGDH